MCCGRLTISASYRKAVERPVKTVQRLGAHTPDHMSSRHPRGCGRPKLGAGGLDFPRARKDRRQLGPRVVRLWAPGRAPAPHRRPAHTAPDAKATRVPWIEEGPGKAGGRGAC